MEENNKPKRKYTKSEKFGGVINIPANLQREISKLEVQKYELECRLYELNLQINSLKDLLTEIVQICPNCHEGDLTIKNITEPA